MIIYSYKYFWRKMLNLCYPGVDSRTYYALYAPAIARFLLIDKHNLFCVHRAAQVLSSKINTVVLILPGIHHTPQMNNDNCLKFTLNHSKFQPEISGTELKQNPIVSFLSDNHKIIKTNFPVDFETQNIKEKLLELQKYAQFVNRCVHAIMLTSLLNQNAELEYQQKDYESFYFNQHQSPGEVTEVMHILLFADNITEAKKQLEQYWETKIRKKLVENIFWPEKIKKEIVAHCSKFYEIAQIEPSTQLKILLQND